MAGIHVLDQDTINQIAAGEVIERPMAVVKELVENAIDAGANSVTIEIKEGGTSLIRITDNGSGIGEEDIPLAFLPHATSKIREVTDLLRIATLGFRGEALASIAAVSQLELITKTREALMGNRYCIEGGEEKVLESVGCPEGTTVLVRNLFYNTPARLKFLKTPATEAGYISGLVERMALSHPHISFRFINQNQSRLHTSGNGSLKDVIYQIYGRDIAANLLEVDSEQSSCRVRGFIGKPVVSRGNRNFMNYFINGRYIKSNVIHRAIEDAYAPYSMQHRYPFTALHFTIDPERIDINVHPQKMELRFSNGQEMYQSIYHAVSEGLKQKEHIPEIRLAAPDPPRASEKIEQPASPARSQRQPEPFEKQRRRMMEGESPSTKILDTLKRQEEQQDWNASEVRERREYAAGQQESLFGQGILSGEGVKECRIIGQVFATYWILEYEGAMYLVDQHAAHEKVLYERFMRELKEKKAASQLLQPPIILTLTMAEEQVVKEQEEIFTRLGYQIEAFGGRDYAVTAVPAHLPSVGEAELLKEVIDTLVDEHASQTPEILMDRLASMSCKAAVKGNHQLPQEQMHALLQELMTLENPYHCPHGRPTMIKMTRQELEKKFKRIV